MRIKAVVDCSQFHGEGSPPVGDPAGGNPRRRPGRHAGAMACRALWPTVRDLVLVLQTMRALEVLEPWIDKVKCVF